MQPASYACDGFAGKRPAHSSAVALETPRGLSPAKSRLEGSVGGGGDGERPFDCTVFFPASQLLPSL